MTWRKAKLGDVCTIEKGNIGITKAVAGEFPLVGLSEERKTHNEYQFDDEAVVIPLISSTGHGHRSLKRIHFQRGKFAVGSILCAVIPKDKTILSAEFLYRYLDFFKEKELVSRMRGMANVSLPISEIASVEIPLPPIELQRNLIGTFSRLEEGKNSITAEFTRQLELVRQLRRAFVQEAIQGKLVEQDFADEPAKILLGKMKAERERLTTDRKIKKGKSIPSIRHDEVPFELPSSWVWCRLDDLRNAEFTLSYGVLVPGGNISDGIPFVRVQDLDTAEKNILPSKSISPEIDKQYGRTKLQGGEILICVVGSIGKVSLVPDAWIGANIARAVCRFMPNKFVSRKFLFYSLNSPYVQDYFQKGYKSIQPTLNVNVLEKTPIPLPPLSEQNRIIEKLDKLMSSCDELEQSIQQSKTQAEMLLQSALKEALKG